MKTKFYIFLFICFSFGVEGCDNTTVKTYQHWNNNIKNQDDLCNMCTKTVNDIKIILEDPFTHKEIKEGMEDICNTFPYPFNIGCVHAIELYFDSFIDFIVNIPTDEICSQFHFC